MAKWIVAIGTLLAVVSCGPGGPRRIVQDVVVNAGEPSGRVREVNPPAEPDGPVAASLGLRVVGAAEEDPSRPNEGITPEGSGPGPLSADRSAVVSGDEVLFKETILFAEGPDGPRSLFLVWNEGALDRVIVDAHYMRRKLDVENREEGRNDRVAAGFDSTNRLWFIPLNDALAGRVENADPTDLHWISIDLELEGGRRKHVHVGFRVLVPLPRLELTGLRRELRGTGASWVVRREAVRNPSARHLSLWLRGNGELALETGLRNVRYPGPADAPPPAPAERALRARAGLELDRVHVVRRNPDRRETLSLSWPDPALGWRVVPLGPFETLELEWIAAAVGARRCEVPKSVKRVFAWRTGEEEEHCRSTPFGEGCHTKTRWTPHRETRTETWEITGHRLAGTWSRSIRLTDPFLAPAAAAAEDVSAVSPHRLQLLSGPKEESEDLVFGRSPGSARARASCQGIY